MTLLPAAEIHSGFVFAKSTSNGSPRPSFHLPFTARPPRFRRLLKVHEHERPLPSHSQSTSTISSDADNAPDFILDETFPGSPSSQSSMSISSPATSPAGPNTSEFGECDLPDVVSPGCDDADIRDAGSLQTSSSTGSSMIFGWKPSAPQKSSSDSDPDVSGKQTSLLSGWKPSVAGQTIEVLSEDDLPPANDLPPMSIECSLSLSGFDESMEWVSQIESSMDADDSWSSLNANAGDVDLFSQLAMPTPTNSLDSGPHETQPGASNEDVQLTEPAATTSPDSGLQNALQSGGTVEENVHLASGITKLMSRMIVLNQQNAELQQQLLDQRDELIAERETHWTELAQVREEAEGLRMNALLESAPGGSMRSPVVPLQLGDAGDAGWTMDLEDLSAFAREVRRAFASTLAERAKMSEEKDIPALLREVMAEFE
ncbi:hypothetical protein PENSPDRAFT_686867 [Peniophora sp. CONT]|nr:hypothetical protein PENSPDRAFT_686867 [Peniophora sp. CONT]